MYNIKQAAARAGVSVPVLRAWERRYGIVSPERSPSGYRRFDDANVARVKTMRGLVESGWSPSAAAAAIRSGEVSVTPAGAAGAAIRSSGDANVTAAAGDIARSFVAAAQAMDPVELERALDDLFSRGSFERVAEDLLFPALKALGDAWAAGDVTVAGEHLASAAVSRRLALALEAAGSATRAGSPVLVGLPPGGRHELGALAFAVAARRAGLPVAYLGADLPVDDWVRAAAIAGAVVVGVVTARDRGPAMEVARALRGANPDLVVVFGGEAAPDAPTVIHLEPGLTRAVEQVRMALGVAAR